MTGPNPGHRLGPIMLPDEGEWMLDAACLGVDATVMFPEGIRGQTRSYNDASAPAKALCARCLVRAECLEYALAWPETSDRHGIFGGLNPNERRRERHRRRGLPPLPGPGRPKQS